MGKRYYCDYCDRSFADGAENRKKHLASSNHINLRKAHYDSFKGAAIILAENQNKKPCRKFHQEGYCEYGLSCRYSHLTAPDIQRLEEEARLEKEAVKTRTEPDIDSWLQSKISKIKEVPSKTTASDTPLPPALFNVPNIPLSLRPPSSLDLAKVHKEQLVPEWA